MEEKFKIGDPVVTKNRIGLITKEESKNILGATSKCFLIVIPEFGQENVSTYIKKDVLLEEGQEISSREQVTQIIEALERKSSIDASKKNDIIKIAKLIIVDNKRFVYENGRPVPRTVEGRDNVLLGIAQAVRELSALLKQEATPAKNNKDLFNMGVQALIKELLFAGYNKDALIDVFEKIDINPTEQLTAKHKIEVFNDKILDIKKTVEYPEVEMNREKSQILASSKTVFTI